MGDEYAGRRLAANSDTADRSLLGSCNLHFLVARGLMAALLARVCGFGRAGQMRPDQIIRRVVLRCWLAAFTCIVGALASLPGAVRADELGVMDRPRPDYDAKGIPLGAFRLYPSLNLNATSSNNVFETKGAPKSDIYFNIAPAFKVTSEWSRHMLQFAGSLNRYGYTRYSSEDLTDWSLGAGGRLDIQRGSEIFANASNSKSHEGRSSPNSPGNIKSPVRYSQLHADGKVTVQPNRLGVSFGGELDRYTYESTPLIGGGTLNNDDRDRDQYRLDSKVFYDFSPGYSGFISATYNRRNFDLEIDRTGVNRDSNGYSIDAGVELKLTHLLQGKIFAGYLDQQLIAPLQNFSGLSYGAMLDWYATPVATFHLSASRVLSDTTIPGASLSNDQSLGAGVDYEIRRNLIARVNATYLESEFVGASRDDVYA